MSGSSAPLKEGFGTTAWPRSHKTGVLNDINCNRIDTEKKHLTKKGDPKQYQAKG